ncbi:acetyl-CoA carboxylase biotin carboxyl carrier protein [Pseudaquidulcibacter saccharophilus]|uniref:acetyl-CoA carboxylase biotin carboxyl carrier protein n=1 Tax=Pseudaquidulcibacter saccharophilus TaxID=2831900 RepID=UPI001EFF36FD|nr:acetyl-CoA carboxylase biotin carboxyl carrier protein [Pseudaquidulcibacter saccharophilus]
MPSNNGFDTKLVKDLAKILRDSELTEIEIDNEGTKIRVTRNVTQTVVAAAPVAAAPVAAAPVATPAPAAAAAAEVKVKGNAVTSPMVGTIYLSPEPGAAVFAKVGDTVKEGQQLFIIEAMKTMNSVTATASGVIKEILVSDAQPVEFGEALCIIE